MESSDLALIQTLDALLQEVSVTRAARRLGLSTPAVSHALSRLRERFSDPLLVRAGRQMVLTPIAEQLRPSVHEVMTLATSVFEQRGPFDAHRMEREFVVSVTDHVLMVLGLEFDTMLRTQAPRIAIRFVPPSLDDAQLLRQGAIDVAVGIYGELPPELRTRHLLTDRFVSVVRKGHPRVGRRLDLDAFVTLEHVQVAPRGQPGGYLDDTLARMGLRRRVARAVPYFHIALGMIATTDYVLTVSERVARSAADSLGLQVFEPPIELKPYALSMLWHPRNDADEGHRWLRERLAEVAARVAGNRHVGARSRLDRGDPTTGQNVRRSRKRT